MRAHLTKHAHIKNLSTKDKFPGLNQGSLNGKCFQTSLVSQKKYLRMSENGWPSKWLVAKMCLYAQMLIKNCTNASNRDAMKDLTRSLWLEYSFRVRVGKRP